MTTAAHERSFLLKSPGPLVTFAVKEERISLLPARSSLSRILQSPTVLARMESVKVPVSAADPDQELRVSYSSRIESGIGPFLKALAVCV